jgi:hypothetical protein
MTKNNIIFISGMPTNSSLDNNNERQETVTGYGIHTSYKLSDFPAKSEVSN